MDLPTFSREDQDALNQMAESYEPRLLEILEKNKKSFLQYYDHSTAKEEVSFEEFFIWYYHFLYTRTTDILAQKNLLNIPESGVFRVKMEN